MRSRLLLVLKKLLFSAALEPRQLACDGVLVLIEAVLKGQLVGAGGGDEGFGSQSSQSSGPSIDLPLLMELLSLLRRVLSSAPAIKQVLYARLTALYAQYPLLRKHILDLLMPAFRYIQSDREVRVPFQLSLCLYKGVVSEPLPHLMMTVVHALCYGATSVIDAANHANLRLVFKDCIARMVTLTPKDIGYNRKAAITPETDVSRCVLMHGLFQAGMEYALCEDMRGVVDVDKEQLSDEGWQTFKDLFARFIQLDDWLTGRKQKEDEKAARMAAKKPASKRKKKDDSSDSDSDDSDDEEDDSGGKRSQKSPKGRKKSGSRKGKDERGLARKKLHLEQLLTPLALNMILRRLVMQEYRLYVSYHSAGNARNRYNSTTC